VNAPTPMVFMSYRRGVTSPYAGRLGDAINQRFGDGTVFIDSNIEPAVDFVDGIKKALGACRVMLVVIGPKWAALKGRRGPRLSEPGDFVRLEVETALQNPEMTVIPLLVKGARMPHPDQLPESLRGLPNLNGIQLSERLDRWNDDVRRILRTLERLLPEAGSAHGAGAVPEHPPTGDVSRPAIAAPPRPRDAQPSPPPLPPVLATLPHHEIVGRETEQAELRRIVADAGGGARRVVLIGGEAGIGKTRLAADTARAAHSAGFAVGWGASGEGLSAPYGVWHDPLSFLVAHTPDERLAEHVAAYGNAISHLLPTFHHSSSPAPALQSDPETQRNLLFAATARLLRTICATQPVALVLDDLHWANPESLRLLRYVAGETPDLPLLVIGTYGDDELPHDYPVGALHGDLLRLPDGEPPDGATEAHGGVVSLQLRRLTRAQVRALITAIGHHDMGRGRRARPPDIGPGGQELADALSDETEGTPFFVRQVLRHLHDSDAVGKDRGGRWLLLRPISELGLPQSVHGVVRTRVEQLGTDARKLLLAAAVIGRSFDARLLEPLVRLGEDRLAEALVVATRGEVLVELRGELLVELDTPPKQYEFAHACFQHSLYDGLLPQERMRHHVAVAMALEAYGQGDPGELAHHWVTAGDPQYMDRAVHYARRAGEHALEQLGFDDAVRWFEFARDRLAHDEDAQRCDVLTGLGLAERQVGRAFSDTLSDACEIAAQLADHERLARAVVANTAGPFGAAGQTDERRVHWLKHSLVALPGDAPQVPLIEAILGKELYFGKDPGKGADHCRQALEHARARSSPRLLAAVLAYATAISPITPPDQHAALSTELAALGKQLEDAELEFRAASSQFIRAMHVGDPGGLKDGHETMKGLAARTGLPILRWTELWSASARQLITGDLNGAEEQTDAAARLARSYGVANWEVIDFGQRLGIAAERDVLPDFADEAERHTRRYPHLPLLQLALPFIAAEMREEKAASRFAAIAGREDRCSYEGLFLYEQTRAACLARCADIALRLGEQARYRPLYSALKPYENQFATPAGISSRGSIHVNLGRLASALGREGDAEWHFDAAEKAHDRLGAPLLQARTYLAWGQALLPRNLRRAVGLLRRARKLAADYGGTATKREVQTLLDGTELTCEQQSSALLS
jgi:hypothetical protein